MIKRYEWDMWRVTDMDGASAEGWEYVSGPEVVPATPSMVAVHKAPPMAMVFACLMRREVVPGKVQREESRPPPFPTGGVVFGGESFVPDSFSRLTAAPMAALAESVREHGSPALRNCWTCKHTRDKATRCARAGDGNMARVDWIGDTHHGGLACPKDADGCPGWAAKEVTP